MAWELTDGGGTLRVVGDDARADWGLGPSPGSPPAESEPPFDWDVADSLAQAVSNAYP